jgi:hypothetical protein
LVARSDKHIAVQFHKHLHGRTAAILSRRLSAVLRRITSTLGVFPCRFALATELLADAFEVSKRGLFPGALSRNHLPRLARNEYHVDRHADLQ